MRQQLLVYRTASQEEVAAYWPGGEENPERDLWAWILCHANLCRFLGRKDEQSRSNEESKRKRLAQEAIAEVPEVVQLTSKDDHGRPLTRREIGRASCRERV